MKTLIIALTIILMNMSGADASNDIQVKDWFYTISPNDDGYHSALTGATNTEDLILILGCSDTNRDFKVGIYGEDKQEESLFEANHKGTLYYQIDDLPVDSVNTITTNDGFFLKITGKKRRLFISRLADGNSLKIKLNTDDKAEYPIFSLKGSFDAMLNTFSKCIPDTSTGFSESNNTGFSY